MSQEEKPLSVTGLPQTDRVLRTLERVARFIGSVTDLNELLREIMLESEQLLRAQASSLWLYDDLTDELYFEVVLGDPDVVEKIRHMRLKVSEGQGIAGQCAQSRRPMRVGDAQRDDRHCRDMDDASSFVTRGILAVPLIHKEKLIGVLQILNRTDGRDFDDEDLLVMEIIGNQAAIAIENAHLIAKNIRTERLAAMGTAMAGISHSIKNILTGVRGAASLIEHALSKDPEDMEIINATWPILQRNEGRISELIQDMLQYAKQREPDLEDASVTELCQEVYDLSLERANLSGVTLNLAAPEDDPLTTAFEPKAMHDCVLNLVTNAVEATPSGEDSFVTLQAGLSDDKKAIIIRVEDNGMGIPETVLKKIWEPFFSTKGKKGTGLGLAMTRKTVEEHGGQISAFSQEGEGTVFTISLPICKAPPGRQSLEDSTII